MMVLSIPDCHVEPDQDLTRFTWLSRLVVDYRPDFIIIGGDFISCSSLSHWDRNKRMLMEGRRYQSDIDTANKALNLLFHDLHRLQKNQRRSKKKVYRPTIVYLIGNHEEWVDKYIDVHPELEGAISIEKDLKLAQRGIRYLDKIVVDNVLFQHAMIGNNGVAIACKHTPKKALEMSSMNTITYHTHKLELMGESDHPSGVVRTALTGGCFFEGIPQYIPKALPPYWRGVQIVHTLPEAPDFETISIERMRALYG